MFTTPEGRPFDPSNLMRGFRALLKTADQPAIRFHDLRHSCASLLLAGGVPAHVVMALLGHSDIRVTVNTYGHVMPAGRDAAATLMQRLLG